MQEAGKLQLGFGMLAPPASFTVNEGTDSTLRLSLALLLTNSGWLKTLKTSSFNSSRIVSDLGILNAFITEMSKRYSAGVRPALRATFPLRNWKSNGLPEKLSTGPPPLTPAGASNDVWRAAQLARPAAWHAATPDSPTAKLVPVYVAMFVAARLPFAKTFGRWLVSDPNAGKADPANPPPPVETGYGLPACSVLKRPNVQLL